MESTNLPFEVGTTFFQGSSIDAAAGNGILGNVYKVSDARFGLGYGRDVYVRAVRNTSGGVLTPRDGIPYDTTKPYGTSVAAPSTSISTPIAGVVDPKLGSQTVAANDIFYVVVRGPVKTRTPAAGVTSNIAVGAVVRESAATAGRINEFSSVATGHALGNEILSVWGRTMEAKLTTDLNSETVVDLNVLVG